MFLSISSIYSWAFSAVFDDHLGPPCKDTIAVTQNFCNEWNAAAVPWQTLWNFMDLFNLILRQNMARDCGESRTEYNILGLKSSKLWCINTVIKTDRGRPTTTIVWEWLLARLASIQCTTTMKHMKTQWSIFKTMKHMKIQDVHCIATPWKMLYRKKNSSPHQSTLSNGDASFGNSSYSEIIWP